MRTPPLFLLMASCTLLGCQDPAPAPPAEPRTLAGVSPGKGDAPQEGIQDFFFKDHDLPGSLEASGISVLPGDRQVTIVLDNDPAALLGLAREPHVFESLSLKEATFEDEDPPDFDDQAYEGLTFDPITQEYYALVEAQGKRNRPRIDRYDRQWRWLGSQDVKFDFETPNKGMEGLAHVWFDGELHLLMLCEENACNEDGEPGQGRIEVFALEKDRWEKVDRIKLPKEVEFEDYSGLDVRADQIVVTSQESSAFWVGALTLEVDDGKPDWKIQEDGQVWRMPEDEDGRAVYCNVEGVSISDARTFYLVSDQRKTTQPSRCKSRDQALHRVVLPR